MSQAHQGPGDWPSLPASLVAHVETVFRGDSEVWLDALSDRLPTLMRRWDLELGDVLTGGWNSTVLACTFRGQRSVLKVTLDPGEASLEAKALRLWGTQAAVEVLGSDPELGGLLLARLEPGTPLQDSAQVPTAIAKLHAVPAPTSGFPSLADFYADAPSRLRAMAREGPAPFSDERVWAAGADLVELSSVPGLGHQVLLHGDAVPANFLFSDSGYRAIDPRAKVGDPCFDAAFWALFSDDDVDILETATAMAVALGLPTERVTRWTRAIAVDRSLQVAGSPLHAGLLERLVAYVMQFD